MVDYQTISIVFTGLSISLAAFYYINILRSSKDAKQRELMYLRFQYNDLQYMEAYTYVMSKKWTNTEEFRKHFDPVEKPEAFAKYVFLGTRFQNLGLMLRQKTVDPDLMFRIFSPMVVIQVWEKFREHEMDTRKRYNHPTHYEDFEYLYNEAKKRFPEINPSIYGYASNTSESTYNR
jgi:hypothetical protein